MHELTMKSHVADEIVQIWKSSIFTFKAHPNTHLPQNPLPENF